MPSSPCFKHSQVEIQVWRIENLYSPFGWCIPSWEIGLNMKPRQGGVSDFNKRKKTDAHLLLWRGKICQGEFRNLTIELSLLALHQYFYGFKNKASDPNAKKDH